MQPGLIYSCAFIENCVDKFVDFAARVLDFGKVSSLNARLPKFLGSLARIAYTLNDIVGAEG